MSKVIPTGKRIKGGYNEKQNHRNLFGFLRLYPSTLLRRSTSLENPVGFTGNHRVHLDCRHYLSSAEIPAAMVSYLKTKQGGITS